MLTEQKLMMVVARATSKSRDIKCNSTWARETVLGIMPELFSASLLHGPHSPEALAASRYVSTVLPIAYTPEVLQPLLLNWSNAVKKYLAETEV